MPDETPTALDDVRVLDLTRDLGAYCTKLLADLGADVIKIEPPSGDPARNVPPFYHDEAGLERSLYFFNLNTNKRSLTLDLTGPDWIMPSSPNRRRLRESTTPSRSSIQASREKSVAVRSESPKPLWSNRTVIRSVARSSK